MHAMLPLLIETEFPPIRRGRLETLQVNMGYLCNQSCLHCHVNAGPRRTEIMTDRTIEDVLEYLRVSGVSSLDLTGGAPELNPGFRYLVRKASELGVHVIDRCNLTVLQEQGQTDLPEFLCDHRVEITASLPCYLEENVDRQRGSGVFNASIDVLRKLNSLGYGEDPDLLLNLVFNPQGPELPPDQAMLEQQYKSYLAEQYEIRFNRLFALVNMPIQRFGSTLVSRGEFSSYMELLKSSHCPDNLGSVMCCSLISIDWQGFVYDCDFNQMLDICLAVNGMQRPHIRDITGMNLEGSSIAVASHCYGCTAGQGSGCGGALDHSRSE